MKRRFITISWIIRRALGPAALGLLLVACTGDAEGDTGGSSGPLACEHGMSYDCACPDGSMGTQLCAHDSSGFEQCMCGGADAGTVSSGPADGSASGTGSTSEGPGSSGPEPGTTNGPEGSTGPATTATESTGPTNGAVPTVQINHPGDGEMRPAGVLIPFIGEASDAEDGVLSGASLVWTDSVEGEIGQGDTFDAMLATLGDHTITLTATDSDGNVAEDSITITIFMQ